MQVLVIGQGGREHAIVRGLKNSPSVSQVHIVPGNPGIGEEAICHEISPSDVEGLFSLCQRQSIDLIVVGPEDPLAKGVATELRGRGFSVFGPGKEAAQLEASKIFSKQFMVEAGVPTAKYDIVRSVDDVRQVFSNYSTPYILKADGLAAGKGVFICESEAELIEAAENIFDKSHLGEAGRNAILEECLPGWELSFHILVDGKGYQELPLAQDHKRLYEKNRGPNTGGMGTVSPLEIDTELRERIEKEILNPVVEHIQKKNMDYRGVLYVGLMITESGPQVLEFNVRFGDPEAQVMFPLLDGDWGQALLSVAKGELTDLTWKPLHAACVVLAAPGYPEKAEKGVVIEGDVSFSTPSSYFLHAGVTRDSERGWVTHGGRVMNSIGLGSSRKEAIQNAYQQSERIQWAGMQVRSDIGATISSGD